MILESGKQVGPESIPILSHLVYVDRVYLIPKWWGRLHRVLRLQEYIGYLTVINSTISDCPKLRLTFYIFFPLSVHFSGRHFEKESFLGDYGIYLHLLAMHCGLWRWWATAIYFFSFSNLYVFLCILLVFDQKKSK